MSVIAGWGHALPDSCVSNQELMRRGVETDDEWIVTRTGIRQRYMAAEGEMTSHLAARAARAALAKAGRSSADVDAIILATATPDNTFPATAARVQALLGMEGGFAFDVQAVCSGFVYALSLADNFIRLGQARRVLVIGAEVFSRLLDWQDRGTCVLFGDGAGAVLLEAQDHAATEAKPRGILSTHLHSDGRGYDLLRADGGPGSTGTAGHVRMQGREVFRHAVTRMGEVIEETLAAHGLTGESLDWLVPHQANRRIIETLAERLGLPMDRVVVTIDQHANCSAASIPLALTVAAEDGRLQPGQLVMLVAMGAGFTWGSALLRW
ncbi:MAG: ketoacyl-ACP synthase III [Alphaproteobacteria bacterium]|nr:MAG: ketoacyl-ACP synthase III [Alphaproteobacteria bacterium]